MSFSRPVQWYHSHADPIWPDGTFKAEIVYQIDSKAFVSVPLKPPTANSPKSTYCFLWSLEFLVFKKNRLKCHRKLN